MHPSLRPLLLALLLSACAARAPATDPLLLESIAWYTGEAGRVDDPRARVLLEQAAADGDALSVMWLARVYSTGRMTYAADKEKAVALAVPVLPAIETLAAAGDAEAAFLLGTAWAEGLGKPVNPEEAVRWYREAAALDHTLAQHNLGNVHAAGTGVMQDHAEAVRWWRLAADKGDAIPQLQLGRSYEAGRGVAQDLQEARRWYAAAAALGNPAAAAALTALDERLRTTANAE